MRKLLSSCASVLAVLAIATTPALAQTVRDSTGDPGKALKYGDVVYSSTWDRVSGKPDYFPSRWQDISNKPPMAERWPKWGEVTGKPSSFPPANHNHDDRYLKK